MSTAITLKKVLSQSENQQLNKTLALASLRDRVLFGLLRETGMRGAELRELTRDSISADRNFVEITGKKGGRSRTLVIPEYMRSDMDSYLSELSDLDPLFPLSPSGLKYLWYRVRPTDKGVHSLRHTFAVNLYRKTKDIKLVQNCLGHRSINNTMVYVDFVYVQDELKKILNGGVFG